MKKRRVIFFDIDDTLMNRATGQVPEDAKKALKRLASAGYVLCIATGRDCMSLSDSIINVLGWNYWVCCGGHVILDSKLNVVEKIVFPSDVIRKCEEIAQKHGIQVEFRCLKERFVTGPPDIWMEKSFEYFGVGGEMRPQIKPYTDQEVVSLLIFPPDGKAIKELDEYEAIDTFYGRDTYCDITLNGVSKVSGIYKVLELLGVSTYIAFGDSENDIEMIKNAEIGIAMGNATERVKSVADYVTADITKGGIAQAAEYLLCLDGLI